MFNLDPVAKYKLSDPPIAQALAQVRYPLVARLQSLDGIAPLQDALSSTFPYMDRVSETTVTFAAAGAQEVQQEHTTSWQFTDDSPYTLIVGSNVATLSANSGYENFSAMAARFRTALDALQTVVGIRRCERVAARYLNVVPESAEDGADWRKWFRPEIVGWPSSAVVLGDTRIETSITQTHLIGKPRANLPMLAAETQAVIRHGTAPRASVLQGVPPVQLDERSFLLDLDFFLVAPQEFSSDAIMQEFKDLHSEINRFFRWSLTKEGEARFGLQDRP